MATEFSHLVSDATDDIAEQVNQEQGALVAELTTLIRKHKLKLESLGGQPNTPEATVSHLQKLAALLEAVDASAALLTKPDTASRHLQQIVQTIMSEAEADQTEKREKLQDALIAADCTMTHPLIAGMEAINAAILARRENYPWADIKTAGQWVGASKSNEAKKLNSLESSGRIFSLIRGNVKYYPAFQFDTERLEPLPIMADLLAQLSHLDGYGLFHWFTTEESVLNAAPADVLRSAEHRDRLLELAELEQAPSSEEFAW